MTQTRQIRIQTPGDPPIAPGELVEVQGVGLCVADATGTVVSVQPEEMLKLRAENERLRELVREAYQEGRVSEEDSLLRETTRAATSAWESSEVRRKLDSE